MWRKNRFFTLRSPYIIMNRRKIDNNSSNISFWDLYQCAREWRKRINRIFLSTILHIHIEFQRTCIKMGKFYFSYCEFLIRVQNIDRFFELYIWIVSIELRCKKRGVSWRSGKEKPNPTFWRKNLKSKKWLFSAGSKMPPCLSMRKTMMECG